MAQYFYTALFTASILILLCNVFGNVLVIMVIRHNKKLHNANTCLLSNLASSDLVFAIVTFIDIFLSSHQSIYSFADFIFHATTSIYLLVALAVERYFAILKPFVHLTRAVKSLMWKVILAIWLLAGGLSAPGFVIASLKHKNNWRNAMRNTTIEVPGWIEILNSTYSFVIFTFGLILPSATMLYCYARIIYHMWFNAEANKATSVALLQSRRKLTKLFVLVTIIFLIAWAPTFTRLIVLQFVRINEAWKFEMISLFLGLAGSTANPVIYSLRCPRFRREVVKLLACLRSCKRKRQPHVTFPLWTNRYSLRKTERKIVISVKPVSIATLIK